MRHILAFVLIAVLGTPPAAQAGETPAREVVQTLHDALLDVMQAADALGFDGRRDYLWPVMDEVFDMAVIARTSAGRHWRQADADEKQRMVEIVTRLSVTTYAARFDGYSGESFRIVSEQPAPRDMRLVNTEIVKSDGETVQLNYLIRETESGWRIVDVYLDGVYSELALRRADYARTLKQSGFEGLFAELEKKVAGIEAEERE